MSTSHLESIGRKLILDGVVFKLDQAISVEPILSHSKYCIWIHVSHDKNTSFFYRILFDKEFFYNKEFEGFFSKASIQQFKRRKFFWGYFIGGLSSSRSNLDVIEVPGGGLAVPDGERRAGHVIASEEDFGLLLFSPELRSQWFGHEEPLRLGDHLCLIAGATDESLFPHYASDIRVSLPLSPGAQDTLGGLEGPEDGLANEEPTGRGDSINPSVTSASHSISPDIFKMTASVSKSLSKFIGSGFKVSGETLHKQRIETCKICDHFTGLRCNICGCFVSAKARMKEETCPIGKW